MSMNRNTTITNCRQPVASRGRATQQSRDTRKINKAKNQLSLPHRDVCKIKMDINKRTTKHRAITDSHNGSNNKQKVNNKRRFHRLRSLLRRVFSHKNLFEACCIMNIAKSRCIAMVPSLIARRRFRPQTL